MARRNQNLAGLAALGALGYALSRGRGELPPVEDRQGVPVLPTGDDQYNPDVRRMDSEAIYDETGAMSPFRRNLETGELYNPNMTQAPARVGGGAAPVSAPVRSVAPAGPQGRSYSAADAQRMRDYDIQRKMNDRSLRPPEEPGLENLSSDLLPIGRFGKMLGRGVQSARGALATRAVDETPVTFLGASGRRAVGDAGRLEAPAVRQLGSEPGKLSSEPGKLTGPSKRSLVERDRAARAAAREAEKEEFNRRGVDRFMESTFEGGMKKGGKVKAKPAKKLVVTKSGGRVSSASKRADGIATKGKTKGRMI